MGQYPHKSIMLKQFVELFSNVSLHRFVDGTVGAGGHLEGILEAHSELSQAFGIDQDPDALRIAKERLSVYGERVSLLRGNFSQISELIDGQVDGIFLDLGVSSMQLDRSERGFSFMREGPLDMRMNPESPLSAETVVNEWSEAELRRIIRSYGEEPRAGRAARVIVENRPFTTTLELAACLETVLPREKKRHGATRVFQALRLAVNSELEVLREVLPKAIDMLRPGGRLGIISFHSLEDRIVKQWFRQAASDKVSTSGIGGVFLDKDPLVKLLTHKPIIPTEEEIKANPRARSSRMRFVEKL